MINKLKITNFQSHKKTTLSFSKYVNVISGKTDSGKSAVFRSLKWLIANKPSGDSFKRKGAEKATVSVFKNGIKVSRVKGKENLYLIGKKKYRAFGANVPDDISKLLNISEINLQSQMTLPFLLSSGSGEVARYLNEVISLDKVDKAFSKVQSSLRRKKIEVDIKSNELEDIKRDLKKYQKLDQADGMLAGLEMIQESISRAQRDAKEIKQSISRIKAKKEELGKLNYISLKHAENELIAMVKTQKECLKLKQRKGRIKDMILRIKHGDIQAQTKERDLAKLKEKLGKLIAVLKVCPVCEMVIERKEEQ